MAKGLKRNAKALRAKRIAAENDDLDDSISDNEYDKSWQTKSFEGTQPVYGDGFDSGGGVWNQEIQAIADMRTLLGLFYSEDWVHIVADRYAQKISSQKLLVHRRVKDSKSQEVVIQHDHQINRLLEQPNDYQDYHAFMYAVVVYYVMLGNCVINHQVISKRLIPLPTENINIRFNHQDRTIKTYDVMGSSSYDLSVMVRRMSYHPREIIHIRRPHPGSLIWGLSPFIPARKSILFSRYSAEYLLNFYLKGAQPGVVLSMEKEANEKLATKLLTSFEKTQTGRKNQRKTLLLPKGVTATSMDHKIGDQNLVELVNMNRETVINILGAPKDEFSIAEGGSLGSEEAKQRLKNWWAGPLRSAQRIIAGAMTRALRSQLGDDMYLDFDNSDVEVLQEDKKAKAELAEKLLQTHTLNEIRQELYNKAGVEGGDEVASTKKPENPFGGGFGGFGGGFGNVSGGNPSGAFGQKPQLDEEGNPIDPKPEGEDDLFPDGEEKALDVSETVEAVEDELDNRENVDALTALVLKDQGEWFNKRKELKERNIKKAELAIAEMAIDLFSKQAEAVINALPKLKQKSLINTKADQNESFGEASIRFAGNAVIAREVSQEAAERAAENFVVTLIDTLMDPTEDAYSASFILPPSLVANPDREEAVKIKGKKVRAILEDRALKSFAWISQTNTEIIMDKVEDGIKNSRTLPEIAQSIISYMTPGEGPRKLNLAQRAMTIARTEVFTASSMGENAAMQVAAKRVKKLKKVWITSGDVSVRGHPGGKKSEYNHYRMQGEVRDFDKPFSNGLMHPHDPKGAPGDVINCRCVLLTFSAKDAASIGLEEIRNDNGPTSLPLDNPRPKGAKEDDQP